MFVPSLSLRIIRFMNTDATTHAPSAGNTGVGRLGIRPFQFGEGLHGVMCNCGNATGEPDQFGERTGCPTSYPSGIAEV